MNRSEIEQAIRDGLLQGVKDHLAKITDTIIGDPSADHTKQVERFAVGLKATRGFCAAALAEVQRELGDTP